MRGWTRKLDLTHLPSSHHPMLKFITTEAWGRLVFHCSVTSKQRGESILEAFSDPPLLTKDDLHVDKHSSRLNLIVLHHGNMTHACF